LSYASMGLVSPHGELIHTAQERRGLPRPLKNIP